MFRQLLRGITPTFPTLETRYHARTQPDRADHPGASRIAGRPLRAAAVDFQVGVLPNVSARIILASCQPFREFLQENLNQPVQISTAPDFVAFHARTIAGDYDLATTAANLGCLAQVDHGLRVIGIYDPSIPGLLVMSKGRPVKDVADLKGQVLALANPQSPVALRGIQWLREQGLVSGTDFRTAHARNEDSPAQLLSHDAPLAMMSMGEFRVIREGMRSSLQIFREFARVPGLFLVTGPRLNDSEVQAIRGTLLRLMASDEGRRFGSLAGGSAAGTGAERSGARVARSVPRGYESAGPAALEPGRGSG